MLFEITKYLTLVLTLFSITCHTHKVADIHNQPLPHDMMMSVKKCPTPSSERNSAT